MLSVADWLLVKKPPESQHKCFMDSLKSSLKACQVNIIKFKRVWNRMSGSRHLPGAAATGVKHAAPGTKTLFGCSPVYGNPIKFNDN